MKRGSLEIKGVSGSRKAVMRRFRPWRPKRQREPDEATKTDTPAPGSKSPSALAPKGSRTKPNDVLPGVDSRLASTSPSKSPSASRLGVPSRLVVAPDGVVRRRQRRPSRLKSPGDRSHQAGDEQLGRLGRRLCRRLFRSNRPSAEPRFVVQQFVRSASVGLSRLASRSARRSSAKLRTQSTPSVSAPATAAGVRRQADQVAGVDQVRRPSTSAAALNCVVVKLYDQLLEGIRSRQVRRFQACCRSPGRRCRAPIVRVGLEANPVERVHCSLLPVGSMATIGRDVIAARDAEQIRRANSSRIVEARLVRCR